jgi:hypothetical protein
MQWTADYNYKGVTMSVVIRADKYTNYDKTCIESFLARALPRNFKIILTDRRKNEKK